MLGLSNALSNAKRKFLKKFYPDKNKEISWKTIQGLPLYPTIVPKNAVAYDPGSFQSTLSVDAAVTQERPYVLAPTCVQVTELVYDNGERLRSWRPEQERYQIHNYGKDAYKAWGSSNNREVMFLVDRGRIKSPFLMVKYMQHLAKLARAQGDNFNEHATVLVTHYSDVQPSELDTLAECALRAFNVKRVHLVDQGILALIGGDDVDLLQSEGNMVIDIGGGTTDIVIISWGEVVAFKSVDKGGFALTAAIRDHIRKEHGLDVSEKEVEELKKKVLTALGVNGYRHHLSPNGSIQIATAGENPGSLSFELLDQLKTIPDSWPISGISATRGKPKTIVVTREEIAIATEDVFEDIIDGIDDVMSHEIPSGLAATVIERGARLTGGGSKSVGLPDVIRHKIGLVTTMPTVDAETCVARGAELVLSNETLLQVAPTTVVEAPKGGYDPL